VRGNCSFCWYWWSCWPSLYKLSSHKRTDTIYYICICTLFFNTRPFEVTNYSVLNLL